MLAAFSFSEKEAAVNTLPYLEKEAGPTAGRCQQQAVANSSQLPTVVSCPQPSAANCRVQERKNGSTNPTMTEQNSSEKSILALEKRQLQKTGYELHEMIHTRGL
jgi:hypothetical protein